MSAHSVETTTKQNSISALNVEIDYHDTSAENSGSQTCENSTPPYLPIGMILSTSVLTYLTQLAEFVNSTVAPWFFHAAWLFVSASIAAVSLVFALFLLFAVNVGYSMQLFDVLLALLLLLISKGVELHAQSIYPLQSSYCDDCYFTQHDSQGELK